MFGLATLRCRTKQSRTNNIIDVEYDYKIGGEFVPHRKGAMNDNELAVFEETLGLADQDRIEGLQLISGHIAREAHYALMHEKARPLRLRREVTRQVYTPFSFIARDGGMVFYAFVLMNEVDPIRAQVDALLSAPADFIGSAEDFARDAEQVLRFLSDQSDFYKECSISENEKKEVLGLANEEIGLVSEALRAAYAALDSES